MPKKAFDYSKTEIYKIIHCDPDKDFCYVGHTTNFTERKKCHKISLKYESSSNSKHILYQMIRENGGWDNFKMVFIEKWPCENLREAQGREQHWIDTLKPNMNMRNSQTDENMYQKERRKEHFTCDCGMTGLYKHKARHFRSQKHIDWLATFKCETVCPDEE